MQIPLFYKEEKTSVGNNSSIKLNRLLYKYTQTIKANRLFHFFIMQRDTLLQGGTNLRFSRVSTKTRLKFTGRIVQYEKIAKLSIEFPVESIKGVSTISQKISSLSTAPSPV